MLLERTYDEDLASLPHVLLLDVRTKTEYAQGHLPGAEQLNGSYLGWAAVPGNVPWTMGLIFGTAGMTGAFLGGLVGAGGGFLVMPALTLLGGLPDAVALVAGS